MNKIPEDEITYLACTDCVFCYPYKDKQHYPTRYYCHYYEREVKLYDAGLCPTYKEKYSYILP